MDFNAGGWEDRVISLWPDGVGAVVVVREWVVVDPVSMIVVALMAGVGAGGTAVVKAGAVDAYEGLKVLVKDRFAGKPAAEVALAEYEKAPEVWEPALRQQLVQSGADVDARIVAAAEAVLGQFPVGTRFGNFTVTVNDHGQVGAIGDGNTVTMGGQS